MMGLFTSVFHPKTGAELQFKTGYDDWDHWEYHVGDKVHSRVIPDEPGVVHLGDDAYFAESYDKDFAIDGQYFIIIKDGVVLDVVDAILDEDDYVKDGEGGQAAYWQRKYQLEPPPLDLWTDQAWADKAKRDEGKLRAGRALVAELFDVPAHKRAGYMLMKCVHEKMQEKSIMRRILPPMPSAADPDQSGCLS